MKKIAHVFQYLKTAFQINRENKQLYVPQVSLIALNTCLYLYFGIKLYTLADTLPAMVRNDALLTEFIMSTGIGTALFLFVLAVVGWIVEAGLFNMYKDCVETGTTERNSFMLGVKKYSLKFLLVNILTIIGWVVLFIPYVIVGLITLMAGFILIPFLVMIFTSMWKVSIVMDDVGVFHGFKNGFSFAKRHFIQLSFLIALREALSSLGSRQGTPNFNQSLDWMNKSDDQVTSTMGDATDISAQTLLEGYQQIQPYLKTGVVVLIPVMSIAVTVSAIVSMIVYVFFGLAQFSMYMQPEEEEREAVSVAGEVQ